MQVSCWCGTFKGNVKHPEKATRTICYCKDCQAFAHALGQTSDVLDPFGGTEIVATLPEYITFAAGVEALACLSLKEGGLLRWYASCCNTPIGNIPRNFKVPHVGLIHTCLNDPIGTGQDSFGPVRLHTNTRSAKGKPNSLETSTVAAALRFLKTMFLAKLSGSYKSTPFFDVTRGVPILTPRTLTEAERDRAMNA